MNDYMAYVQQEMGPLCREPGAPDYQRMTEIVRKCLDYTALTKFNDGNAEVLNTFQHELKLTDAEIEYFGWEKLYEDV